MRKQSISADFGDSLILSLANGLNTWNAEEEYELEET
jgi:hypothetical protein